MSFWKKIKDQDDVELSDDGKTLEVLYDSDKQGNYYIEIPIDFVKGAIQVEQPNQDELWEEVENEFKYPKTVFRTSDLTTTTSAKENLKKRYRITRI